MIPGGTSFYFLRLQMIRRGNIDSKSNMDLRSYFLLLPWASLVYIPSYISIRRVGWVGYSKSGLRGSTKTTKNSLSTLKIFKEMEGSSSGDPYRTYCLYSFSCIHEKPKEIEGSSSWDPYKTYWAYLLGSSDRSCPWTLK